MENAFRRRLLEWYEKSSRPLPWRATTDPYAIWISETMLQQTRVATVLPYYKRFLARFPTVESLAEAPEEEVLKLWSGLGYYSRARNLQRAAKQMAGRFPDDHDAIRALAGVGEYTAGAVASIAFGLPYPAVDGNVLRVLSRVTNDAGDIGSPAVKKRLRLVADRLLDRRNPGQFNQAMMELGATLCLPKNPQCLLCPVSTLCEGRRAGQHNELPVKLRRTAQVRVERTLYIVERGEALLMWQRAGFWELPEPAHLPNAVHNRTLGEFRHSITNHNFRFFVVEAQIKKAPEGLHWIANRVEYLFSTSTRKALAVAKEARGRFGVGG
jgi:A/G-specific adenine glycosylase